MASIEIVTKRTIKLELTEEEVRWLQVTLQNPIPNAKGEYLDSNGCRESIWQALKGA